jgi:hypothetical protein
MRRKVEHNAVPQAPPQESNTVSRLEDLPREIFEMLLANLIGGPLSQHRRVISHHGACIQARYVLDTGIMYVSKGIYHACKDFMDRDHWLMVEIDEGELPFGFAYSAVSIITIDPEDSHAVLPNCIMHIRIKAYFHDCLPSRVKRTSTILIQERDLSLFLHFVRIHDLQTSIRVPPGARINQFIGGVMQQIPTQRGVHGLTILVNVRSDAPQHRVGALLGHFKRFRGPLHEVSIVGAGNPQLARSIEQLVTIPPGKFTVHEVVYYQHWLKAHGERVYSVSPKASDLMLKLANNFGGRWRTRDYTPWAGALHPADRPFQQLAIGGCMLNVLILAIRRGASVYYSSLQGALQALSLLEIIEAQATPSQSAYICLVVGLYLIYCARVSQPGDQRMMLHIGFIKLTIAWSNAYYLPPSSHRIQLYRSAKNMRDMVKPLLFGSRMNVGLAQVHLKDFQAWIRYKLKPLKWLVSEDTIPVILKERGILSLLQQYNGCSLRWRNFVISQPTGFGTYGQGKHYLL